MNYPSSFLKHTIWRKREGILNAYDGDLSGQPRTQPREAIDTQNVLASNRAYSHNVSGKYLHSLVLVQDSGFSHLGVVQNRQELGFEMAKTTRSAATFLQCESWKGLNGTGLPAASSIPACRYWDPEASKYSTRSRCLPLAKMILPSFWIALWLPS